MTTDSRVANREKLDIYESSAPDNNEWIQDSIAVRPLRITQSTDLYVEVHDEGTTYIEPYKNEWEDAAIWDFLSFEDSQ